MSSKTWLLHQCGDSFKPSSFKKLREDCGDVFEVVLSYFSSSELFSMMKICKFFWIFIKERLKLSIKVHLSKNKLESVVEDIENRWKVEQISGISFNHYIQLNRTSQEGIRTHKVFNNTLIRILKRYSGHITKLDFSTGYFCISYNHHVRQRQKNSRKKTSNNIKLTKEMIINRLEKCPFRSTIVKECPNLVSVKYPVVFNLIHINAIERVKRYKEISFNIGPSNNYLCDLFSDHVLPTHWTQNNEDEIFVRKVCWELVSDFFSHQTRLEKLGIVGISPSECIKPLFRSINNSQKLKSLDFEFDNAVHDVPDLIHLITRVPLVRIDMHIGEISFPGMYLIEYSKFQNQVSKELGIRQGIKENKPTKLETLYINMYEHTEHEFNQFLKVEGLTLVLNFMGVNVEKTYFDFSKLECEKSRLKRLVLRKRGFGRTYKKSEFSNFSNLRMKEIAIRCNLKKEFGESGVGDMIIHNSHFEVVYLVFEGSTVGLKEKLSMDLFSEVRRIIEKKKRSLRRLEVSGLNVTVNAGNWKEFEKMIDSSLRIGVELKGVLPNGWKLKFKKPIE